MKKSVVALLIAVWSAMTVATAITACGGPSQFETIQTFEADLKVENATATAEAVIAEGGDPDAGITVGKNTIAAQIQATAQARATEGAESGEASGGAAVGSEAGSEQSQVEGEEAVAIEVPEGAALEGEARVLLADAYFFEPEVIKVKVGTKVIWENPRSSASSARSFEGEAEQWDTGALWKPSFGGDECCGEHTFTIVGCHRYRSEFSGDTATGAVCVVE
jgi:plastocyanin